MADGTENGFVLGPPWDAEGFPPESGGGLPENEIPQVVDAPPPAPPPDPEPDPFKWVPQTAQLRLYRTEPIWARGHLDNFELERGDAVTPQMQEQVRRYHGGGVYQWKLTIKGRHVKGGTRTFRCAGQTLDRGKPHAQDPNLQQTPAPMTNLYPPHQQPGMMPMGAMPMPQSADPAVAQLAQVVQTLAGAVAGINAQIQTLGAVPHQPPPPPSTLDQLKELAVFRKMMREMDDDYYGFDDDDWEEEEPAEPVLTPEQQKEQWMMKMAEKYIDDDGPKKPAAATPATGPRLIRGGKDDAPAQSNAATPPPAPSEARGPVTMADVMATLNGMSPEQRAQALVQVNEHAGADPEVQAAMKKILGV